MLFQPQWPIEFKIFDESIRDILLRKGTEGSAAFDIAFPLSEDVLYLEPGQRYKFALGFAIWIRDPSYAGIIIPRSGLGSKGLVVSNGTGLIDSDYMGEIQLSLSNTHAEDTICICPGDRVAQLVIIPVAQPLFKEVTEFSSVTGRGSGGFGSTGKC